MIIGGYDKITYSKEVVVEASTEYKDSFKYKGKIKQIFKSCACTNYNIKDHVISITVDANEFKDPKEVLHEQSFNRSPYYYKSIRLNIVFEDKTENEIQINFKVTQ